MNVPRTVICFLYFIMTLSCVAAALHATARVNKSPDKTNNFQRDTIPRKDLIDVLQSIVKSKKQIDERKTPKKLVVSVAPAAGYSLTTGFAGLVSGNAAFLTGGGKDQNTSTFSSTIEYTGKNQKTAYLFSNVWGRENKFDLVGDWRYFIYPQNTYGLGSLTTEDNANLVNYSYLRFYETALKKISQDNFIGIGYNLDDHYNITQEGTKDGSVTDFQKYGLASHSVSSGLNLTLLHDDRRNPINPQGGSYFNIVYRSNFHFLGSDQDWQSLQLDLRKYVKLSPGSNNILAFWSLSWFTFGNPPYLDLPSTGWDAQANSGRGYIQGRFRGKDMLYLESEYRFGITQNGLFGGVVFANAETFSGWPGNQFQKLLPAAGAGLRLKFNKHSNTNICLDYGVGVNGSKGFFVNLGEVF